MDFIVDLYWSFRSPYSYIVLPRIIELRDRFRVSIDLRIVHPAAIRNPSYFERMDPLARPYFLKDAHPRRGNSAKKTYPGILTQTTGASVDALAVRQCITKGAFAELRAACVRQGGSLTGEFLDLEREIDSFAMQWVDTIVNAGVLSRGGKHAGLGEQLALIETKARALRVKAFLTRSLGHLLFPPSARVLCSARRG